MSTPAPSAASGLTSEQLHRIELNKKRAQERLQTKRKHPGAQQRQQGQQQQLDHVVGGTQGAPGPPPVKMPAIKNSLSSIRAGKDSSNVTSSHQYPSSRHLSLPSSSSHSVTPLATQSQTVTNFRPHPQSTGMGACSTTHAMAARKPALIFAQPKSTYTSSHQTTSTNPAASSSTSSLASYSAGQSTKTPAQEKTYIPLKAKIKANFVLISKGKFEVRVPYDTAVINMFKKMNTRNYDAKNSLWSFGIEDLSHLADKIRKECKHVEMDLPPRPVVELFRTLKARGGGGKSKLVSAAMGVMDWAKINGKLASTLMHFQKEGVEYAVERNGRVLFADDMGLGKTLQAIAVMEYYRSDWPLLVVCPSSVRLTWAEALKRWIPSLRERDINVILATKGFTLDSLVSIISYDLAVRMAAELKARKYGAVIIDESHFLKNYKTARYKAVAPLVKNAKRSLLLSGTPALSRPIELFTQINMLDRNFSRSIKLVQFGVRYCNGKKSRFGWDFSGASNMQELQVYMEEAIMIRRMKNDVLDQLPEKRRQMILLDLSTTKVKSKDLKQLKDELHEAGKLKAKDRKTALLPLYEKTGRIKIFAINDYILDLMEGGRKVIVFGHHKVVLDSICDTLVAKGYGHIRIDGRTAADMRQTYCDQFQHDEKCLVAVLSITAASAGLTLTASSTVVFAELFWNPGILIQAEDRAYRIGQHNSVNIHYLVAQDTADDYIWLLIQTKLDVLHQAGLAKEDFSKADTTSLKATTQKTLFECFGDLLCEDSSNSASDLPQTEGISDSVSSDETAPSPQCEYSSDLSTTGNNNMSNWFDELDENDFNLIDMNV